MLVLTENATEAIRSVVDKPELPEGAGLRITSGDPRGLAVSAAPAPEEEDQVLEAQGARVFLEPGAAEALDDRVLDAEIDPQGSVKFLVATQ
ncbi:MAG: Fe-S cluster assembly protein HesB [Acidimicrobiia bacterium]